MVPPLAHVVRSHMRADPTSYDLAQAEGNAAWPIVARANAERRLAVLHDDDATRLRRLARVARDPRRKAVRLVTAVKYTRYQRSILADADRLWFVSTVERTRIDPHSSKSLLVPNGADRRFFDNEPEEHSDPVTLFVGPADYDANRQAVEHYINRVLPLVRRDIPDASLWLVGHGWGDVAATNGGVVDRGFVDDLPAELARAAVVVVPLFAGSGTKIKVIEAMAAARPVVVSPIGAEGIPPSPGLRVRGEDAAFAASVIAYLRDEAVRRADGASNRQAVASLSWPAIWERAVADVEAFVPSADPLG